MALGASPGSVRWFVVGSGMRLVVLGVFAGAVGAYLSSRFLSSVVYGVGVTDVATYAGVAALVGGVALVSCALPAASRMDPLAGLRRTRSLRGRRDRSEKVENRGQIFSILRRIVVLFNEKSGEYDRLHRFRSRSLLPRRLLGRTSRNWRSCPVPPLTSVPQQISVSPRDLAGPIGRPGDLQRPVPVRPDRAKEDPSVGKTSR